MHRQHFAFSTFQLVVVLRSICSTYFTKCSLDSWLAIYTQLSGSRTAIAMPRPKKWFFAEENTGESSNEDHCLVLKNADDLIKKPYSSQVLGRVKDVSACTVQLQL